MIELIINQKRRILYFALSMAACSYLLDFTFGVGTFGTIAGLLAATCVFGLIAAVFILMIPKYRGFLEFIAMSSFAGSFIGAIFGSIPLSGILMSIVLSVLSITAFHTPWITRLFRKTTLTSHKKRYIAATKDQIWNALIPGESHPDDYFSGTLSDFKRDNDDPDNLTVYFDGETGQGKQQTLTFLVKSKGKYCRYYFEDDYDAGQFSDGIRDIKITELENKACFVSIQEVRDGLDPTTAIRRWFDNYVSRDMKRLVARLETEFGDNTDVMNHGMIVETA